VGVLAFLALHIFDIFVAAFGAQAFESLLFLYQGPLARVLEVFLVFGLIYHALNGLRIIATDFFPRLSRVHRPLFYGQIGLFLALFIPAGTVMLAPFFTVAGGLVGTFGFLFVLAAIVAALTFAPPAFAPAPDVSGSNYRGALARITTRPSAPRGTFEFYAWLFMRVSGMLLIGLALFHVFWMHFTIGVENISFDTIVVRWSGDQGAFWRAYDILLLAFAFTHGINGTRAVLGDYFHARVWRTLMHVGLIALFVALILMGATVILFFGRVELPLPFALP
jgi:succinate dehydrogenase hydrophobic anchor subunit